MIAECTGLFVIFLVIHYNGIGKQLHLFKNFYYHSGNTKLILKQSSPLIAQHAISMDAGLAQHLQSVGFDSATETLADPQAVRNVTVSGCGSISCS